MTFVKHTWNQFVCRKMKMETSCEVKHHLGPDRASAQFWYLDLEHVRTEGVTFQEIQAKKARRRSQKKKSHNVFHEETYQVPIKKKKLTLTVLPFISVFSPTPPPHYENTLASSFTATWSFCSSLIYSQKCAYMERSFSSVVTNLSLKNELCL